MQKTLRKLSELNKHKKRSKVFEIMPRFSLRAVFLCYLHGSSAQKIDGSQIFKRQLEAEEDVHYSETWKSFRQQDLHRWVEDES